MTLKCLLKSVPKVTLFHLLERKVLQNRWIPHCGFLKPLFKLAFSFAIEEPFGPKNLPFHHRLSLYLLRLLWFVPTSPYNTPSQLVVPMVTTKYRRRCRQTTSKVSLFLRILLKGKKIQHHTHKWPPQRRLFGKKPAPKSDRISNT